MESVEKGDDDTALKSLIDLAESCPKYLRPQLEQLMIACTKIFSDKEQMESWRHLALEIVVTLAETAPAMVVSERREPPRRHSAYTARIAAQGGRHAPGHGDPVYAAHDD